MRTVTLTLATVLAGLALFEVAMQPSAGDRLELGLIFLAMATAMAATMRLLPAAARRIRSIRVTFALLALTAFTIVLGGAVAVGGRMFLSEHDLRLLLVVLGFGVVSGIAFAVAVSRNLSADLNQLSRQADEVASGHLDLTSDVDRRDEVGRLAVALNEMTARLETAELEREESSNARRAFLAAVGHDLRTPLASIRASVEAVRDGVVDRPSDYLQTIENDVRILSTLVDDIDLLARLDSGELELEIGAIDLTEIADEAIDVLRPVAASRDVSIRLIAEGRVKARGDAKHCGRVLRNLIDNAIRHSPPSGRVSIRITDDPGSARVEVIDEGAGFDERIIDSAFEKFTRDDPARPRNTGGSGLGLAIVRGILKALDGEAWIEPGPGGHVAVRLPAAAARPQPV